MRLVPRYGFHSSHTSLEFPYSIKKWMLCVSHGLKIGWCRWGTGRQVKLGRIQVQTDTLQETHDGTFWQLLQLPSQAQYTPFFRFLRFYWRETFIRTHKWYAQNYFTKSISHIKDKYCTFRTLLQTPKIEAKNITTPTSTFLGWSEFLFPFDVDGMKEIS